MNRLQLMRRANRTLLKQIFLCYRMFGIVIIEDNEKAWFPAEDLREFHGIMPHEVSKAETLLFCIHPDGTEGLCCPTSIVPDDDL